MNTPAHPPAQSPAATNARSAAAVTWVEANGTAWRLRSLVAMGHSATRIAEALRVRVGTVQKLLRGDAALVGSELRELADQLWNAWWDKRPPEITSRERQAATAARRRAERNGWCPPAGLDEELLDEPGYRPYAKYRAATGTGVAAEFRPAERRRAEQDSA